MFRQQAHVVDLHEMATARVVESGAGRREELGEDEGVAEQIGGGFLGQFGLSRHLDRHGANQLPAKIVLGTKDGAEGAAGLHLQQLIFAGQSPTQQSLFQGEIAFHGLCPFQNGNACRAGMPSAVETA